MPDTPDANELYAKQLLFEATLFLRLFFLEGTAFGPETKAAVSKMLEGPSEDVQQRLLSSLMAMRELATELILMRQVDTGAEPEDTLQQLWKLMRDSTSQEE